VLVEAVLGVGVGGGGRAEAAVVGPKWLWPRQERGWPRRGRGGDGGRVVVAEAVVETTAVDKCVLAIVVAAVFSQQSTPATRLYSVDADDDTLLVAVVAVTDADETSAGAVQQSAQILRLPWVIVPVPVPAKVRDDDSFHHFRAESRSKLKEVRATGARQYTK
jgi:hypothetical protein